MRTKGSRQGEANPPPKKGIDTMAEKKNLRITVKVREQAKEDYFTAKADELIEQTAKKMGSVLNRELMVEGSYGDGRTVWICLQPPKRRHWYDVFFECAQEEIITIDGEYADIESCSVISSEKQYDQYARELAESMAQAGFDVTLEINDFQPPPRQVVKEGKKRA